MLTAQIEKSLFYDGRYYDLRQETRAHSHITDLFKFEPEVRGIDRPLDVVMAVPAHHRRPPYWCRLKQVLPLSVMRALCVVRGCLGTWHCQVKAVGFKPLSGAAV